MQRLDWQLVRPLRDDSAEGPRIEAELHAIITKERTSSLTEEESAWLETLSRHYEQETLSPCAAVTAPLVGDDTNWQSRVIDEYAESHLEMELEEYMEVRRKDPDCEYCPYASPYSLYPMDPCEFSAGALMEIISDEAIKHRIRQPATPDEMRSLADSLEAVKESDNWVPTEALDANDYLTKAVLFLRFWAEQGFSIYPEDIDAIAGSLEGDSPDRGPTAAGSGSEDDGGTTVH